ncbi:MAG: DUF4139 domain-containing protein [Candidatus Omnitrophica bacterium]|nr:DUF4139 domain-containing protein [Candidatus Omnitrophota bacterium]
MKVKLFFLVFLLVPGVSLAKVDLVTLPQRDHVQLTIYNSADLTLIKESRSLTLKEGFNDLQFSWVNTLIDPTSLEMLPLANADQIDVQSLTYPPLLKNVGLWHIRSSVSGQVPFEISYLTSGLSWRAFYLGTLDPDEQEMRLQGFVRVQNNSGEDYEKAQVRLIVGTVHVIDQISFLANRQHPYGSPGIINFEREHWGGGEDYDADALDMKDAIDETFYALADAESFREEGEMRTPKKIIKEGLSEYFLYTIEGRETVPNGWAKRMPSFDVEKIPVVNLYKYEEERYGSQVVRFLSFKNDEDHQLGETPIPGGMLKVFRQVDQEKHLSYEGQSGFKYIPVDEEVELNMGGVQNVIVEPTLMDYQSANYMFDRYGNIIGWDEIREYKIKLKNTRPIPVKVEIKRNIHNSKWAIQNQGDVGTYEKIDADTVQYTIHLTERENKEIVYALTTFHGRRADYQ